MKQASQNRLTTLRLFALATFAIITVLAWDSTIAQTKKPISKDGLIEAVRLKGYSTRELVKEIKTRGVSFSLTPETEAELRAAGARREVIEAARSNYRPLIGTLNVIATVAGTEIKVSGLGNYMDRVSGLKLPPGPYTITGLKLGYRTVTSEVEIRFGETANVELKLEPLTVQEMLRLAREHYERNDYSAAISLSRSILTTQPGDPEANELMALGLYTQGDYEASIPYFVKAVNEGRSTAIPVLNRHGGSWSGKSLSSGRVTFHRDSFEFYSLDFPDESFRVPYSKIGGMIIKDGMRLNLKVRITKSNRKESEEEYNFYSTDAVATGRIITCPQCSGRMGVIIQLLRQFRPGAA